MALAQLVHTSNQLIIHSHFYFYGDAANEQLSKQIATDIDQHWNEPKASIQLKGKWYNVVFDIKGFFEPQLQPGATHGARENRTTMAGCRWSDDSTATLRRNRPPGTGEPDHSGQPASVSSRGATRQTGREIRAPARSMPSHPRPDRPKEGPTRSRGAPWR